MAGVAHVRRLHRAALRVLSGLVFTPKKKSCKSQPHFAAECRMTSKSLRQRSGREGAVKA